MIEKIDSAIILHIRYKSVNKGTWLQKMNNELSIKESISDLVSPSNSNKYYESYGQLVEDAGKYPFIHQMKRAWQTMSLDGIYCVDKRPVIYFKLIDENKNDTHNTINLLHKKLWNQGIANLLIIISKTKISVFSAFEKPVNDNNNQNHTLTEILSCIASSLELRKLVKQINSGSFYEQNKKYFDQASGVDKYLLSQLEKTRDALVVEKPANMEKSHAYQIIHALLGKIIFTCYLIDRKIVRQTIFHDAGAGHYCNLHDVFNHFSWREARDILYSLFDILQVKFNGNMFAPFCSDEKSYINRNSINIIRQFLNGEDVDSDQPNLFYWPYDFEVISIETISSIYENFLSAEDDSEQQNSGAFYTPRFLAEMVVDIALENISSLLDKKFLDPACGSGIFLVVLFNRIAEEWNRKHPDIPNVEKAEKLFQVVRSQIRGIDIKQTACRITCFSLYISILDQLDPKDIFALEQARGKVLENFLALKKDNWKNVDIPVIIEGSFFEKNLPLEHDFDIIVGNPPWVSRGKSKDKTPERWFNSIENPFYGIVNNKNCRTDCFFPQKEICSTFLWKVPCHLNKTGNSCLLLPSKLLFNSSMLEFQNKWFGAFCTKRIFQLADWHKLLFENAKCPGFIMEFSRKKPNITLEYISPKVSWRDPRRGVITIFDEDIKKISLSELFYSLSSSKNDVSVFWKKYFWGSERDVELINKLLSLPKLGDITKFHGDKSNKEKRWNAGQGFQPDFKQKTLAKDSLYKPQNAWWNDDHYYIKNDKYFPEYILRKENCIEVGELNIPIFYFTREFERYQPPMLIISQGFEKVAYSDFPVLFQDSLQSIIGKREDKPLLILLLFILKSKLAKYYFFHTSANIGTERTKVHLRELMSLPFLIHEKSNAKTKISECIKNATSLFDKLCEPNVFYLDKSDITKKIDELAYEYYDISANEQCLIEDFLAIYKPSTNPSSYFANIPTDSIPKNSNLIEYCKTFQNQLNSWMLKDRYINIELIISEDIIIVKAKRESYQSEIEIIKASNRLSMELKRLNALFSMHIRTHEYHKSLAVFDGNTIYIQKYRRLRFWTRTAALNDADEIAGAILSSRNKRDC